MLLPFREGFRYRLETIVRGQVSSHPETLSTSGNSDSRNDQSNPDASQEVPRGNQEIDAQLPNRMGNMDRSPAVQISLQHVAPDQGRNRQGQVAGDERTNVQQSAHNDSTGRMYGTSDNAQENSTSNWPSEEALTEDGGQHHLPQSHDVWPDDGSRVAVDTWSEGPSDPPRMRRSVPSRRATRFHPPDDDNVYSMELRELLSRLPSHDI